MSARREVLNAFKQLHRARQHVFKDDLRALTEGRRQINDSFKKNKNESDAAEIQKMVKLAKDVEVELLTNVIQAVEKKDKVYELRITPTTTLLENKCYNDDISEMPREPCGGCDCGLADFRAQQAAEQLKKQQGQSKK